MELRTYTGLWNVEKRIYKIYDFTLPMPVPVKTLGVVVLIGGPWLALVTFLGVPFHPPWQIVYLGPPVILAWRMNKPVAEGKRLMQLLRSQLGYLLQAKQYTRLTAWTAPQTVAVTAELWHPGQCRREDSPPELSPPVTVAGRRTA